MDQYFREPLSSAVIAAGVVAAYVYFKSKMNNETIKNSDYFKPAFLVGILVYFIVSQGQGESGPVLREPF
jgi:ABC-type tungstate transport system substrate-binding protein